MSQAPQLAARLRPAARQPVGQAGIPRLCRDGAVILRLRGIGRTLRGADGNLRLPAVRQFHRRLYDVGRLPQTLHLVQILWARYPFDLIHRLDGRTARAGEEHAAILDRVAAGDAEGAVAAVQRHIETGWAELHDDDQG